MVNSLDCCLKLWGFYSLTLKGFLTNFPLEIVGLFGGKIRYLKALVGLKCEIYCFKKRN